MIPRGTRTFPQPFVRAATVINTSTNPQQQKQNNRIDQQVHQQTCFANETNMEPLVFSSWSKKIGVKLLPAQMGIFPTWLTTPVQVIQSPSTALPDLKWPENGIQNGGVLSLTKTERLRRIQATLVTLQVIFNYVLLLARQAWHVWVLGRPYEPSKPGTRSFVHTVRHMFGRRCIHANTCEVYDWYGLPLVWYVCYALLIIWDAWSCLVYC